MGTLFGNRSGRVNQPQMPSYYTARVQTSVQGKVRPLGYGQTRTAGNLLLLTNFSPYLVPQISQPSSSSHAGKGGGFFGSSGGKGSPGPSVTWSWAYRATVIVGFGDSEVAEVIKIYNGSSVSSASSSGAVLYPGTYSQSPWSQSLNSGGSFMSAFGYSTSGTQQIAYRGEAYYAFGAMDFGSSNSVPNLSYEIRYAISNDISAYPDANPVDVFTDYLTNTAHGVPGFSSTLLDDWTSFRNYCRAFSLLISTVETSGRAASSFLADIARTLNVDFVWSQGKLKVVPYTPFDGSANGYSYTATTTPQYDLTDSDFIIKDPSDGSETPIEIFRKSRADVVNHLRLEYASRTNHYNPEVIDYVDDASIANYGVERIGDLIQAHHFAIDAAAQSAILLMASKNAVSTTYKFTIGRRFIRLDPMDVVTLTYDKLGLSQQPVIITEISEDPDGCLVIQAEDYPVVAGPPAYGESAVAKFMVNFNIDPGLVNTPIFFEPPDALANGLYVYCGVSGVNTTLWGGCDVYASFNGIDYGKVGTIHGANRMGVTTTTLPSVTKAASGSTIDSTNTLGANLAMSAGTLTSGSASDMLSAATLCYVGGELIAYQNATLTSANNYNLTPMLRGAYGSTISAHASGSNFLRVDSSVFSIPFTQDRIGSTIYVKFVSFNIFGGGTQSLADVSAFTYAITGSALSAALNDVTNLRAYYEAGFMKLWWDEVTDFRPDVRYEIFKGTTFSGSMQVGDVAHPPFVAFGDATYWVRAYVKPLSNLKATSTNAASVAVAGNQLTDNIVKSINEQSTTWTGTKTNLTISGATGAEALVLSQTSTQGIYEVPEAHWVDVGYQARASINAIWTSTGTPVGQNILTMTDILTQTDILGSAAATYVSSWIEMSLSADHSDNVFYNDADVFAPADIFQGPVVWSDWQKFVPGVYAGRYFKFRLVVENTNTTEVTATVLAMKITVSVPARIDHFQNQLVPAAGLAIEFRLDGATEPRPFLGGPNGSTTPYVNVTWPNTAGDELVLSSLTTSGVTVQIKNGGVGVARSGVNIDVEGY